MRHWTIFLSTVFGCSVLGLALAAGIRAMPVRLPDSAGVINGEWARSFESHYDEFFPAKTFGTNLWAALDYLLFHEGRPGVVVGRNGWLYTDEEFKTYPDAEARIRQNLELIPQVRERLMQHGSALVIAAVPAKTRLYPEFLGDERPSQVHAELYARFQSSLRAAGITAPDLLPALSRCKQEQPVFLRTDTHWTPAGARCAARSIGAAVRSAGLHNPETAIYRTQVQAPQPHRGDLFRFLPLDPWFSDLLPAPDEIAIGRTEPALNSGAGLLDEEAIPRVVLLGTSYSADYRWNLTGALQEVLGEDVVNYSEEGRGPFVPMLEFLRSHLRKAPPRLVIWEIPERYLPMSDDRAILARTKFNQEAQP